MAASIKTITDLIVKANKLVDDKEEVVEKTIYSYWQFPLSFLIEPLHWKNTITYIVLDMDREERIESKTIDGIAKELREVIKAIELEIKNAPFKVGGYEVEVTKTTVTVGCRSLSLEDFDALVAHVTAERKKK